MRPRQDKVHGTDEDPAEGPTEPTRWRPKREACVCGKTAYPSQREVRVANRHSRFRFRAYYCERGRCWHVANGDKR